MNEDKNDIKTRIFSGLFWKFSERIMAQLVTFAVSIVLARLLAPSDYGIIALVMVFIAIANVFVTNGLGSALIQKKDADNIDFSSVLYFNIGTALVIYLFLFLLAPFIANFYGSMQLVSVLRILGLRIPVAAINSVQQAYVSKKMLFKRFFWSTLFGTVVSGIVGIALAHHGYGVWALVAQYLTNTMTDTIVLWFTVRWRPDVVFSGRRVKKLLSYGWKLLCSGLLDTGYAQMRNLVIGKIYSSEDLAFYNKGDQYPNLLVTNINTSISSVLFPAISFEQDNRERVKAMTRRAIKISSYIMWPMMIGLVVIAKPLISIMLTDKWLECVPYLQIACISYALWPIHTANLEAMKAVGRSDLFLKLEIIKKFMGISVLILVMNRSVMAICLSGIFTSIISTFINAYPNKKLLGYSYLEQIKDIMPSVIMSMIMGICIYPITYLKLNKSIILLMQIISGIFVYIIESKIIHSDDAKYVLSTVKSYIK